LIKAGNPLQGIATGLYRTDLFLYSQKEFLAISYPFLPSSLSENIMRVYRPVVAGGEI